MDECDYTFVGQNSASLCNNVRYNNKLLINVMNKRTHLIHQFSNQVHWVIIKMRIFYEWIF